MRISLVKFLRLSHMSLRLLCAPVSHRDACLITLCEAESLLTPVIASDGRMYDAKALQTWLQRTPGVPACTHVVPGCPIDHVDITIWPCAIANCMCDGIRRLWHRARASGHRIRLVATCIQKRGAGGQARVRNTNPSTQMWKRVLNYHRRRKGPVASFRGKRRFTHHPASPFVLVHARERVGH